MWVGTAVSSSAALVYLSIFNTGLPTTSSGLCWAERFGFFLWISVLQKMLCVLLNTSEKSYCSFFVSIGEKYIDRLLSPVQGVMWPLFSSAQQQHKARNWVLGVSSFSFAWCQRSKWNWKQTKTEKERNEAFTAAFEMKEKDSFRPPTHPPTYPPDLQPLAGRMKVLKWWSASWKTERGLNRRRDKASRRYGLDGGGGEAGSPLIRTAALINQAREFHFYPPPSLVCTAPFSRTVQASDYDPCDSQVGRTRAAGSPGQTREGRGSWGGGVVCGVAPPRPQPGGAIMMEL